MLNQVVLVGRLMEDPEVKNGVGKIILVVPRPFKNEEGVFENDYIRCELHGVVTDNVKEYCHKGDLVGVKGSVRCSDVKNDIVIVAEKITFLNVPKKED